MAATRKLSTSWTLWAAAALLGILGGYSFLGHQPVQAQPGGNPFVNLQDQIKALQISQAEQGADLFDLYARVIDLEDTVFGGCCGGGGSGGGGGDLDADGDGFSPNQGDCNDADETTYPGAEEIAGDGRDNDCDGQVDEVD